MPMKLSSNSLLHHTILCVIIQIKKTSNYPLDGLEPICGV
nr:MAG TPA: hypothetical protein [Caudoviricetes sp.]